MQEFFKWFWTLMIWGSLAWYSYLLFHVGWRGGRDIIRMAKNLSQSNRSEDPS